MSSLCDESQSHSNGSSVPVGEGAPSPAKKAKVVSDADVEGASSTTTTTTTTTSSSSSTKGGAVLPKVCEEYKFTDGQEITPENAMPQKKYYRSRAHANPLRCVVVHLFHA